MHSSTVHCRGWDAIIVGGIVVWVERLLVGGAVGAAVKAGMLVGDVGMLITYGLCRL